MGILDLNSFDKILYINLDHREDRKKLILDQLKEYKVDPLKIHRISAHYDKLNGTKGCTQSHIKALDYALENNLNNVLILEDDAVFVQKLEEVNKQIKTFFDLFKNEWDVFFLGSDIRYFLHTTHKDFVRVVMSFCSHAYIVNGHYLNSLRTCFISSLEDMKDELFHIQSYNKSLDIKWGQLQCHDRWYSAEKSLLYQRKMWSDINDAIKGGIPMGITEKSVLVVD